MPEITAFSFSVERLKLHMAWPRYSAGGFLKVAASKAAWVSCAAAVPPSAPASANIAQKQIRCIPVTVTRTFVWVRFAKMEIATLRAQRPSYPLDTAVVLSSSSL